MIEIAQSKKTLWALLGCLALAFIIYSNSLRAPFIHDDLPNIAENRDITELRLLHARLSKGKASDFVEASELTRPLTYFSIALNYKTGKLDVTGYHIFNVLLHVLTVLFVFLLARKTYRSLFGDTQRDEPFPDIAAFLCALFFSLHPINADVVAHVIHRSDSMSTLFYLTSVLFFLKTVESSAGRASGYKVLFYFVSLACFVLSYLSKQIAATLPLVILLADFFLAARFDWKAVTAKKYYHLPFWIILFIVSAGYYLRYGSAAGYGNPWPRYGYMLLQPFAVVQYLRLLVVPFGQCIDHFPGIPLSAKDPRVLFSAIFIAAAWVAVVMNICKYSKTEEGLKSMPAIYRLFLFSFLWFFVTLIPTSSFMPTGELMAEKRLYLPGIGFYLFLSAVPVYILKGKKRLIITAFYLALLAALTWNRSEKYNHPEYLWREAVAIYPDNYRAYNNLGAACFQKGDMESAISYYRKVLEYDPGYFIVYDNLGKAYAGLGRKDDALLNFRKAAQLNPDFAVAYNEQGLIYDSLGKYAEARTLYEKAIAIDGYFYAAYNNLGMLYYKNNDMADAVQYLDKAIDIYPGSFEAYNNLGLVYAARRDIGKAKECFSKALEIKPDCIQAYDNLAQVYAKTGDHGAEAAAYRKILQITPGNKAIEEKLTALGGKTSK